MQGIKYPQLLRCRFLLDSRLRQYKDSSYWYGTAFDWWRGEYLRVWCERWLPLGVVVVCDSVSDTDNFHICPIRTQSENGLPDDWDDRFKDAIQIPLFPED